MNYLVFQNTDVEQSQAQIQGCRADELINLHELRKDLEISALVYGRQLCRARITDCQPGLLKVVLSDFSDPPEKKALHFIVGICRPQTVKKVISAAFALGAGRLDFIRAANSEKSYLSSSIFKAEELQSEMILAMSQCGDSIPLEVNVFERFKPYLEDNLVKLLSEYPPNSRYLADMAGSGISATSDKAIIAIGPEAGWNDFERAAFKAQGFQLLTLGERQLRVEQALLYISGKVFR